MNGQNSPSRKATDGQRREYVKIGSEAEITLKEDQRTGKLTRGIVAEILTSSAFHPRGIKVRLQDGRVGRVQKIYPAFPKINGQEYQEGLT
ncbi:MAG: hypothetical protein A3A32_00635 [Candidatus Wildermuthbacteria bacterium RIFCSPLOWO2_01_FULL_48_35]|uniref:YwbE family protein n=2 Tax=Candidatus Wildermuthiibacteriota TaxID=1817923 RepID=A0A1G2RNV8_9BACT|nr:MAG: hypothetical protein UY15_C0015G0004 [Parcubacteria group bacterium GW2011_GWA2_47_9]OHA67759.1 MAG: hypothetical protein A3D59_03365 [Candidatus Wildermuthbacteria bacterium RIFCSPHIGHO2_02_FULL_47_17]OHA74550.1 MAG: hypothetical protein A3A32_00635 [Candidatus Wildermuthbacteria bacterium RIFCSPLOWO2_01_FULL_48_35]